MARPNLLFFRAHLLRDGMHLGKEDGLTIIDYALATEAQLAAARAWARIRGHGNGCPAAPIIQTGRFLRPPTADDFGPCSCGLDAVFTLGAGEAGG